MKPGKTTVATFNDREKAVAVREFLEKSGISAEVADESFYQRFWFFSKPLAFEKVYVAEEEFEKARALLQTADTENHILQDEVRCPQCGSVRIDYPQFTRKFVMTTFVEVACFIGLLQKKFFCKSCNYTWPPKINLRPKDDILQWPKGRPVVKQQNG